MRVLKLAYLLIIGSCIVVNASNKYSVLPDDEKACLLKSWV